MMENSKNREKEKAYKQLGDAFRYGVVHEFEEVVTHPSKKRGKHLYACLAYMNMNGYLDNESIYELERELIFGYNRAVDIKTVAESFTKILFTKLLGMYQFSDLNELIALLNEVTVPDWYFDVGYSLIRMRSKRPFESEGYLYYITTDGNNIPVFARLRTALIISEEDLDEYEEKQILGIGYDEIYGFDKKNKKVYLNGINQKGIYQCYDLSRKEFIVYKGLFLKMHNGTPVVVTKGNQIAYIAEDAKEHNIKPYFDYEEYQFDKKSNLIKVFPKGENVKFFYPYSLDLKGETKELDIEEGRSFIWKRLCRITDGEYSWNQSLLFGFRRSKIKISTPKELTINTIMKVFEDNVPDNKRCMHPKYILFEKVFDKLADCVDKDKDITRLLYALFEADRKLRKYFDYVFPSEAFCFKFEELDSSRIEMLLKEENYDEIVYCLAGTVAIREPLNIDSEMIGEFGWNKDDLSVISELRKEDGIILGDLIIPPANLCKQDWGMIIYNWLLDMFYVISTNRLSYELRKQIIVRYKHMERKVTFIVLKDGDENWSEVKSIGKSEEIIADNDFPTYEEFGDLGSLFEIADYSDCWKED